MKIIYLTDIHDALKELRVLLQKTEADLYFLSGDILYKAFYDDDKIYQFVCIQEEFYTLAKSMDRKIYPMDLATQILRFPERYKKHDHDGELENKARDYRRLFELATRTMKEKYELIEELLEKYSDASALVLPGNYDIDLLYTALRERDMHKKTCELFGLKIAGYGGAPIATSGIPEKLAVAYHETKQSDSFFSEPQSFFLESQPDIMLLHNPAYGFFDKIPGIGHVGGLGVRNYLDDHSPSLVLSGHVHEDYGVALSKGTVFLNPSNFGGVDSPVGWQEGGTFAEIQIDSKDKNVKKVSFLCLREEEPCCIQRVQVEEGRLSGGPLELQEGSPLNPAKLIRDQNGAVVA